MIISLNLPEATFFPSRLPRRRPQTFIQTASSRSLAPAISHVATVSATADQDNLASCAGAIVAVQSPKSVKRCETVFCSHCSHSLICFTLALLHRE